MILPRRTTRRFSYLPRLLTNNTWAWLKTYYFEEFIDNGAWRYYSEYLPSYHKQK